MLPARVLTLAASMAGLVRPALLTAIHRLSKVCYTGRKLLAPPASLDETRPRPGLEGGDP